MSRALVVTSAFCVLGLATLGSAGAERNSAHGAVDGLQVVQLTVPFHGTDLFHAAPITVSGTTARRVDARLLGAIDRHGLAYRWTPYPWQRLRLVHGTWRGVLPAPPLPGVYQVQLRLGDHELLSSARWLLRVFPSATMTRQSFSTPVAAVRDFVARLAGDQVLVAWRRWPLASFDHRDPRLHRLFVIAYAPRADERQTSRSGLFVTTVRDAFRGNWRLLDATVQPYG